MHAIERLRYVARSGDIDATELACEAAYALGGLARDRRALVLACRRLLEFHPRCGPLWWVSAHALESVDLRSCIATMIDQLEADESVDELFALPSSHDVVVAHVTRPIVRALSGRPDLAVRLLGDAYEVRSGVRFFADSLAGVQGYLVDEVDEALRGATFVVVEARAASAAGYLFDEPARILAQRAMHLGVPLYVMAGVGRILPAVLFSAMERHVNHLEMLESQGGCGEITDAERAGLVIADSGYGDAAGEQFHVKVMPVDSTHGIITERGLRTPLVAFHRNSSVSHLHCPAPAELLAPFGLAG